MEDMKLSDNPKEALQEIAGYLKCLSMTNEREVKDSDNNVIGYYQLTEYLEGCLQIADECMRIVNQEGKSDE